jgi:hypothetical protein
MFPGITLRRLIAAAGGPQGAMHRIVVLNGDGSGGKAVRFTLSATDFFRSVDGPDIELKANDTVHVE